MKAARKLSEVEMLEQALAEEQAKVERLERENSNLRSANAGLLDQLNTARCRLVAAGSVVDGLRGELA